jgi:hypothetical protein
MLSHTSFLRASSNELQIDLDVTVVANGQAPPVAGGPELAAFTQLLTTDHRGDLTSVRNDLVGALGVVGAERAVGVAATFQMMNRALDGVGAPVAAELHPLAVELGFAPDDITR